jgi:hypothetical protein
MTMQSTEIGRDGVDQSMQACIDACMQCHGICEQTIRYCLNAGEHANGGRMNEAGHMRLLMDCAAICQASQDFMLRDSEFHPRVCGLCAEICKQCAQDCERFGGDAQMKACANACRQCASACQRMAATA